MKNRKVVWDAIAPSWSNFRNKPVAEAVDLAGNISGRKKILDIGCGNGRNLLPFSGHELYGIDFSENMISVAEKFCKKHNVKVNLRVADAKKLPFDDDYFDIVLMLNMFHHFPRSKQEKVLSEVRRVMKPGALVLCSVWYKKKKGDRLIDWKTKTVIYKRYYYFFKKPEIKKLLENCGFTVKSNDITSRNKEKNIVIKALKTE